MNRILVIEDDRELLYGLKVNLEDDGYEVLTARSGERGMLEAARNPPDAVILDVMMPGLGGFEVCRSLRDRGFDAPIVILTARGRENDKIRGFAVGADDYITKPFSVHELLARLRAIIRRSRRKDQDLRIFWCGDTEIDFTAQQVRKKNHACVMSNLEFEVLHYFIAHRGEVISREDLLTAIWGYKVFTTRAVDNLVARLRSKIEDNPHQPRYILGVYGVGYKFVA